MAVYLEIVVIGVPTSNQAENKATLAAWKAKVKAEIQKVWTSNPLTGNLKSVVINFHKGEYPSIDIDNLSKPIHDVMNKLVFTDDRQIRQLELAHLPITSLFSIVGVAKIIVDSLREGIPFVYLRIEDPVEPFPLPK
jgi:hypothetical protein